MRAARMYGKEDLRVEEVELKELGSNDVKVKVGFAGICGSDLKFYKTGTQDAAMSDPIEKPYTLGHEYSGVVEEVGSDVTNLEVGDKVAINPMVNAKDREGYEAVLNLEALYGSGDADGGFADYSIVDANQLSKLQDSTTLAEGAMIEPLSVALQAIRESEMEFGDSVAIYGAGPIGLAILLAAKAAGARDIYVFDLSDERLNIAKEMGVTAAINSGEQDPVEYIGKHYETGVDRTFEVAGVPQTFDQALNTTRTRGMMTIVAMHSEPLEFNPIDLMFTGVKLATSTGYEDDIFELAISMVESGQIDPTPMITNHIELEDIVEDGIKELSENKEQAKILVKLNGEVN